MNDKNVIVRFAEPIDNDRVSGFIAQQFEDVKEFAATGLQTVNMQGGKMLIAEFGGNIISTLQMDFAKNEAELLNADTAGKYIVFNAYPTVLLSKAATLKTYRNTGLNSLLREAALKYALQNKAIASLSGFTFRNAHRLHLLKKIGYNISLIGYAGDTHTTGEVFLYLNRNKFEDALSLLAEIVNPLKSALKVADYTGL